MAISRKRIVEIAKKWQKMAAHGRRRIMKTSMTTEDGGKSESSSSSSATTTASVARKGHLFVYTIDGKRFMIPLQYLSSDIFRVLLKISEEEFGLPRDGPITLPFDGKNMECILSLLQRPIARDVESAVLTSVYRCSALSSPYGQNQKQQIACNF